LYTPLLYCWARRWGLQEADAADLVQDVLTLLFQKLPEFAYDRHKSFRGWLHTVALNKWRERQRRRTPVNLAGSGGLSGVPDADDPGELDEAEYCRHLVQQALAALRGEFPPRTWMAFELHVMAGRRAGDAADQMGVSVNTIYAAKSRVLSRLRQELDGLLD
jgi:RNA polymerase sigma-70 factor (ECF subfamily)